MPFLTLDFYSFSVLHFPDFLEARGVVFSRFWRLQAMLFRNFGGSGPSPVPILRILGIYVISGRFPRRKGSPILRPGEHFAPDFGVIIFDNFSRGHFS